MSVNVQKVFDLGPFEHATWKKVMLQYFFRMRGNVSLVESFIGPWESWFFLQCDTGYNQEVILRVYSTDPNSWFNCM